LAISVELLSGTYDAGTQGSEPDPEWPPHPARLFCALVAAAGGDRTAEDERALLWLERQDPPAVICGDHHGQVVRSWQPLNDVAAANRRRQVPEAYSTVADPTVTFWWAVDDAPLGALRTLAARVPYLGRSSSPAMVTVTLGPPPERTQRWEPVGQDYTTETRVRVPRSGYLDALDEHHRSGISASRATCGKVFYADVRASPTIPSLWGTPHVFRLDPAPPMPWALRVAEAARASVLRLLDPDDRLAGHRRGEPHACYLPLPIVGHDHADGHLRGLAVAVPAAYDEDDHRRMRVALAELERPGWRLFLPGGVEIGVTAVAPRGGDGPAVLDPWRWSRPSREWVTATPAMLDRWPRAGSGGEVAKILARSVVTSGYTALESIDVSSRPLLAGSVQIDPDLLVRRGKRAVPRHPVWCRLRFAEPVRGPIAVGALRSFGVGLCAPADRTREAAA
jgi:CRISPR-associated protein Csb2